MNPAMKPNRWSADAHVRKPSLHADVGVRAPAAFVLVLALFATPLLAADAPAVRVATPTRGDIHRFVTQPGTIRPLQQATLYAKVSGYLKSIAVDKGDVVKAGALLAELEAPELQADMARAQAELAKAQADFARADADLNRSGADIALATAGVAKAQADHVRGQAEVQQASSVVARTRADFAVAKAEVAKAQAEFPRQAAELKLATAEHNRLTRARQQAPDLVTQSELDQALARLETTRALEASLQAGLTDFEAGLQGGLKVSQAGAEAADTRIAAAQSAEAAAQASLAATTAGMQAAEAQLTAVRASQQAAASSRQAAAALVEVARANAGRVATMTAYLRLTAPFSGVITARQVDLGAFIPAATTGSTPQSAAVLTLMDFDTVRVQVAMTELEAALVAKGQPVKVALDGMPGKVFEGTVTRFAGALDETTRTMLVEAELPNPGHTLRPGMYATVRVGVEKHSNVMLVPNEALVMEKTAAFLFLADGGKAKKTPVKIGFNDGAKVEIVSGLATTAKVILVGKMALTDGQAVNVQEGK